jgi:hypothetical protein
MDDNETVISSWNVPLKTVVKRQPQPPNFLVILDANESRALEVRTDFFSSKVDVIGAHGFLPS